MVIDWQHFTPWASLSGGLLIGLSTALLLLTNGKIAGISGIVGGLLNWPKADKLWRLLFLVGMLIAPITYQLLFQSPTINIDANWIVIIIAGLLVGFGTRYSGGCTSGHGICGISRLSVRSIAATLLFICSGMIVVYIVRHILGA